MTLPRMPEDKELLDLMRSGLVTIPDLTHKIYGYPETEMGWIAAKSKVLHKMNQLAKWGFIRKTGRTVQMGYGRNVANIWEVVD